MIIQDTYAFLIVVSASILMSLMITLVYKFTTNQKEMKHIKDEMKRLQKEMKASRSDQKKMMEINAELMKYNSKYMMKSMRSSLFTLLPALLIFMFLSNHIAYTPIAQGMEFNLTIRHNNDFNPELTEIELPQGFELLNMSTDGAFARYRLKAGAVGNYSINIINENTVVEKGIIVTEGREYAKAEQTYSNGAIRSAKIEYRSLTILSLPFWPHQMNWLWLYIIFAIITGSLTRKILNVY